MTVQRIQITASPCTGGAGVSTANAVSSIPITGVLLAVHLAYLDSPPGATTDVTLAWAYEAPAPPILTVANAATDGWFYPMAQAVNQSNVTITGMGQFIPIADYVRVTIAQANDGDGVTATILWDDNL